MLELVYSLLLGGFIVHKPSLPSSMSWMVYTSYFWYGYQSLIINEFEDKSYGKPVLKELDVYSENKWVAVGIMACLWLWLQVITFLVLLFFNKEKR